MGFEKQKVVLLPDNFLLIKLCEISPCCYLTKQSTNGQKITKMSMFFLKKPLILQVQA